MKSFDWKNFLKVHPVFKSLSEDDIDQLLKDEISEERVCLKNSVIIREGELGSSVFFIGSGSVRVVLQEKDGREMTLSILKKGEFFGEIATFEKMPRSATVIAQEKSTLLEAEGNGFSKIIEEHPDIAFRIFSKLSERLRYVSEHFLSAKLKDVDEKFNLFNAKLDAELKAVDASLNAAQVVFDQTKEKSEQVINNADKSWTHLKRIASASGILVTVIISIFAWLGINKYQDISNKMEESLSTITVFETKVINKFKKITKIEENTKKIKTIFDERVEYINEKTKEVEKLEKRLDAIKYISAKNAAITMLPRALDALDKQEQNTVEFYEQLLKLDDPTIFKRLLDGIEVQMDGRTEENDIKFYEDLLATCLKYGDSPTEKIKAYYLLLVVLLLNDKYQEIQVEEAFSNFKKYVETYRGPRIEEDLSLIDILFENQDREKQVWWLKRIKPLIPLKPLIP